MAEEIKNSTEFEPFEDDGEYFKKDPIKVVPKLIINKKKLKETFGIDLDELKKQSDIK